jgi:hypothetical protein
VSEAIDRAIVRAATPHGNVTRQRLLELGLGHNAIDYRIHCGRLFPSYAGVYGVGRPARTALERADAAVLACGPRAALFCTSAMSLWGFWRGWAEPFEVVALSKRRCRPGIIVHRSKYLDAAELTRHQAIRVTRPARTLFDVASRRDDAELKRDVNNALHSHFLKRGQLVDQLLRHPNHRAASRIRYFVAIEGGPTRSDWEEALPAFCLSHGLPVPVFGLLIAGHEADAVWLAEKVVLELDSWEFHQTRVDFEADRDRDVDRLVEGFVTVRITWERMFGRPVREARRLHAILADRRSP